MKKRILFWLSQDMVQLGLAKFYSENPDFEIFGISDAAENLQNYLSTQKVIQFKKIHFMHNSIQKNEKIIDIDYLKSIEEKYGINLMSLALNERYFYSNNNFYNFSDDEVLKILEQECKFFEKVLDEIKPDYVFMLPPNFHYHEIFCTMCKNRNIKLGLLNFSRFGKRCIISSNFDKIDLIQDKNDSNKTSRTQKELLEFLRGNDYYDDNIKNISVFMKSKTNLLKALFHYIFNSNNNNSYTHYGRSKLKTIIITGFINLRERYRKSFIDKNLAKELPSNSNYIYFPLQISEENGLLLGAPFHTNQLEIIRNISQSLPVGYELYVKEHPAMYMRGWRTSSFYKSIMNLPHVKLCHPDFSHEKIVDNSSMIITIASTVGMEAAFHGKPSIVFVDVLYSMLPSVIKLNSIQELPQTIRTALNTKVQTSDVNKFVNHIEANSFKLDLYGLFSESSQYFHFGGFLHSENLHDNKFIGFLKKFNLEFEIIFNEYKKFMSS